jgi:hypothetical protein
MDVRRYWTAVQLPEYTAQFDAIIAKYALDIIGPALDGLLWGVHTNPRAYDVTIWKFRVAKSAWLGLTIPRFRIFFQIANENENDEHILLCWIEEMSSIEEMTENI